MTTFLPNTIFRTREKTAACLLVFLMSVLIAQEVFSQSSLPGFPGAEGFGANTVGGRGGTMLFVTNLNDAGPGSFREACEATVPRIVMFRVTGTIFLQSTLYISSPYITIVGQSAPGGGITTANEAVRIKTHDVIIRGIRFRPGDLTGFSHPLDIDAVHMLGGDSPVYNVILDHCSFSWGIDKNLGMWGDVVDFGTAIHDITIQWCISSEGLHSQYHPKGTDHSMGMFFSSVKNVSAHHNLFVHNHARQPQFSSLTQGEAINNVVYNYGDYGTEIQSGSKVNVIANYYKTGVDWAGFANGINVADPHPVLGPVSVYVQGNIGPGRPVDEGDEWNAVTGNAAYRSFSPPVPLSNVVPMSAEDAFELVVANSGAFPRDSVDDRIVYDVLHGTGSKITSQSDVGGWPILAPGTSPLDSDNDGMPNDWEIAYGLNPNNAADGNGDKDHDGYLNNEDYSNELIVPEPAVAYAGEDQMLCSVTTATLDAESPSLGSGFWSLISGGGTITSPTNPTSTVTNLASGVNQFEWRIVYKATITSRDTVSITNDVAPTIANAGTDQTPCAVTSTTISGNTPANGTGVWRVVMGSATIANPNNPTTTVSALQTGVTKFEWSITGSSSCPVSRDTMSVTVSGTPTIADAGPDDLVCDHTDVHLDGNRAVVGTGHWNVLIGSAVIDDPSNNDPYVTGLQTGVNSFEWVITNGTCPTSRDTVIVTAGITPTSDFSYVINGLTVQFTSLATNASTYLWDFADGTTSTQQNPTHTFSLLKSYRVGLTAGNNCGSKTKKRRVNLGTGMGILSSAPSAIDFGEVPVNTPASGSIVVTNLGTDTLDVESIGLADGTSTAFTVAGNGFSLGPENSMSLDILFQPDQATVYDGSLSVIADDTTSTVGLAGTGTSAGENGFQNELSSGLLEFGPTLVGTSSVRLLTISNENQVELRVDSVVISLEGQDRMSVGPISLVFNRNRVAGKSTHIDGSVPETKVSVGKTSLVKNPSLPRESLFPIILMHGDAAIVSMQYSPRAEGVDTSSVTIHGWRGKQRIQLSGVGTMIRTTSNKQTGLTPKVNPLHVDALPDEFSIQQNYPNPFNPSTTIHYALSEDAQVTVKVYNMIGQLVRTLVDGFETGGYHESVWDGRNESGASMASGIYIYRMRAGEFVEARKMLLMK